MDININTAEVRAIANSLSSKKEELNNIYRSRLAPLLRSIDEYLRVSGLSYDEVVSSFDNVFNSLDQRMGDLSGILINKIIPEYENAAAAINNSFNNTFANEMRTVLATMKK
jgi:uncharacterized protein YukE